MLVLRICLTATAATLIAALFLPIVWWYGAPVYMSGTASSWDRSPFVVVLTAISVASVLALAVFSSAHHFRGPLLMSGTTLAVGCVGAVVFTLMGPGSVGFHPHALAAVFVGALLLLLAAYFAEGSWFQFRIRTLIVCAWFAALVCALLRG